MKTLKQQFVIVINETRIKKKFSKVMTYSNISMNSPGHKKIKKVMFWQS